MGKRKNEKTTETDETESHTDKEKEAKKKNKDRKSPSIYDEQVNSMDENCLDMDTSQNTKKEDSTDSERKKSKKKSKCSKSDASVSSEHGCIESATTIQDNAPDVDVSQNTNELDTNESEGAKRKKSKKKNKDHKSNSLGTIDSELLETTAKTLQNNGLDVDASEKATDDNESSSKKKKKKKKEENKEKQEKQEIVSKNRTETALDYLHRWNSDKASWKFNKMHQIRLLHMMYDTSSINDEDFQTLLLYIAGMKGHAKEVTHNQAMKFVDGEMEKDEEMSEIKEQRAREVVQVLS